jgi:hypothetical protein
MKIVTAKVFFVLFPSERKKFQQKAKHHEQRAVSFKLEQKKSLFFRVKTTEL